METIEYKTSDGQTWTLKRYLSRKDRRVIGKAVQASQLEAFARLQSLGVDMDNLPESTAEEPLVERWADSEADVTLERAVVAWSYTEALSPDTLMDQPDYILDEVVARLQELYRRRTDEEKEDLEKK